MGKKKRSTFKSQHRIQLMRTLTPVVLYPAGALKYSIKSPFTKSLFNLIKQYN